MAKKKSARKSTSRPSSSPSSSNHLHDKHPNLIWLLPLLVVVFLSFWFINKTMQEKVAQSDAESSVNILPTITVTPLPTSESNTMGY